MEFSKREIFSLSTEVFPEVVAVRREIHRNPELSYKEYRTSKLVASKLRDLGFRVREGVGGTGVVADLNPNISPTIALRADMDALPVKEETGLDFSSINHGVMHACGHDSHTAMLLGAGMVLSKLRNHLGFNVRLIFQPAEEAGGRGGALPMIEDGAMNGVNGIFGIHVFSDFPSGTVGYRSGPIMAAPDSFRVVVEGRGGHASKPHDTIDPVFVGSQIVVSLYGWRSRYVKQTLPFVVSVSTFHGGTKDNIIPDRVELTGTFRTLDEGLRQEVKRSLPDFLSSVCRAYGAKCEIGIEEGYPVTVNHPVATEYIVNDLRQAGVTVREVEPVLGGEDMSRFLSLVPGAYFFLGVRNEEKGITSPNHSSKFTIDEDAMVTGVYTHVIASTSLAKMVKEERGTPSNT